MDVCHASVPCEQILLQCLCLLIALLSLTKVAVPVCSNIAAKDQQEDVGLLWYNTCIIIDLPFPGCRTPNLCARTACIANDKMKKLEMRDIIYLNGLKQMCCSLIRLTMMGFNILRYPNWRIYWSFVFAVLMSFCKYIQ